MRNIFKLKVTHLFFFFCLCLIFSKEITVTDDDIEILNNDEEKEEEDRNRNRNKNRNRNINRGGNDGNDNNDNEQIKEDYIPFEQIPFEQRTSFVSCTLKHKLKYKLFKSTRSSGTRGCDQCDKTISSNDPHHYCYEKNDDDQDCNLDLCVGCYFKNTNLTKNNYLKQIKQSFRSTFERSLNKITNSNQSKGPRKELMENGIYKDIKENERKIFNYDAIAPTLRPGDEITVTIYETGTAPGCDIEFRIKEIIESELVYQKQRNGDTNDVIIGEWIDSSNNSFKINFNNCVVTNLHHQQRRRTTWNLKDLRLIPGKIQGNGANIIEENAEEVERSKGGDDDDTDNDNDKDNDDNHNKNIKRRVEQLPKQREIVGAEIIHSASRKRSTMSFMLDNDQDDVAKDLNPTKKRKLLTDSTAESLKTSFTSSSSTLMSTSSTTTTTPTSSKPKKKQFQCFVSGCPNRGNDVRMVYKCKLCNLVPVSCPYCYKKDDETKLVCASCRNKKTKNKKE